MVFERGVHVTVIKQSKYRDMQLVGMIGTVHSVYGATIGVILDEAFNPRSALGVFYFIQNELLIVNEINDIMEENNMQNVNNYLNVAKIKFVDERYDSVYDYANYDPDLKEGDLCVVKSAKHGLGLARVTDIVERTDLETCREIVAKVCTDDYDRRVDTRTRAAELKAKMQERAKQLQDIALYQMLAKDDPDMMSLLTEYQNLFNV